jgi:hypothetical protein
VYYLKKIRHIVGHIIFLEFYTIKLFFFEQELDAALYTSGGITSYRKVQKEKKNTNKTFTFAARTLQRKQKTQSGP